MSELAPHYHALTVIHLQFAPGLEGLVMYGSTWRCVCDSDERPGVPESIHWSTEALAMEAAKERSVTVTDWLAHRVPNLQRWPSESR